MNSNTLSLITNYHVERNVNHGHLTGKWLVVGTNREHGVCVIDSWHNSKKQALAVARDHNEYLAEQDSSDARGTR